MSELRSSLIAALPGAALFDPAVNVALAPNPAGGKLADGLREALSPGELVGALLADAQEGGNLCDSDEFHPDGGYALTASSARRNLSLDNVKGGTMQAVCLHRNNFGQYCERRNGHTGNCRHRMFSREDAQRAYLRQLHVGDPRWTWQGNGWLTTDPVLVDEALERYEASKGVAVA